MTSKRVFDLICAVPGLVVLLPLLVAISVWIKLDSPGPIIFRQLRVGRQGITFEILKFRSMVRNADALGHQITIGEDPRITRVGKFIRKYKLDELPQLWNVLRGDMSIVGPRPEVPRYVAFYGEDKRQLVLSVCPGITDPASIEFYDESELLSAQSDPEHYYVHNIIPRKLELYERYIETSSLTTDLRIIFTTLLISIGRVSSRRLRTL